MRKGVIAIEQGSMSDADRARVEALGQYIVVEVKSGRKATVLTWYDSDDSLPLLHKPLVENEFVGVECKKESE